MHILASNIIRARNTTVVLYARSMHIIILYYYYYTRACTLEWYNNKIQRAYY